MGYSVFNVNGVQQTGFTLTHRTLRDGLRCSAAKAFLRPIQDRVNLHISMHTFAEMIMADHLQEEYTEYCFRRTIIDRS